VRELQPAAANNIGLKIICLAKAGEAGNTVDLSAILQSLGCRVLAHTPQGGSVAELMNQPPNQPSALLVS